VIVTTPAFSTAMSPTPIERDLMEQLNNARWVGVRSGIDAVNAASQNRRLRRDYEAAYTAIVQTLGALNANTLDVETARATLLTFLRTKPAALADAEVTP
jgi:hypothetical protein